MTPWRELSKNILSRVRRGAAFSLLDSAIVDSTRIHGPRQLTDIYLLALAVQHDGRLVTFDAGVPLAAVRKATAQTLLIL